VRILPCFLILALSWLGATLRGADAAADERIKTLLDADRKWSEAQTTGDVAAMGKMTTEDFSCVGYGGRIVTRTEWMHFFEHMTPEDKAARAQLRFAGKRELLSTRIYGDTGMLLVRADRPGSEWLATAVWVMRNGAWKLAGCHGSTVAVSPVIERLAGAWKEDVSKRKSGSGVDLRFRRRSDGGLEELRGPEARPEIQHVILDGQPRPVPGANYSIVWRQINANEYERKNFGQGQKLLYTRWLRIANDGNTLTEESERASDQARTSAVYRRTGGGAEGLAGRWVRESIEGQPVGEAAFERVGANAIKVSANWSPAFTATLGGPPVPLVGEGIVSGMTVEVRMLDEYAIELFRSRDGTPASRSVARVSADGKTLTLTVTQLGPDGPRGKPATYVYQKQ
jgi:hypothetical protein